jgi:uracil-DNA glycosylase
MSESLAEFALRVKACRICVERPIGPPLPHAPRPVLRVSEKARILVAGQAPGARVHASGLPFDDASGDRLRAWMGIDRPTFYDESRIAVAAMGFCFPGVDARGADLPPRRECRAQWHDSLFALMPAIELILAVGRAAQDYHFGRLGVTFPRGAALETIVRATPAKGHPRIIALPHPSWRNTGWLRARPWFDEEILPVLRTAVASLCSNVDNA